MGKLCVCLGNESSARSFLTKVFLNPGPWTSARSGHGCPHQNDRLLQDFEGLTKVFAPAGISASMSAGYPAPKLTLWAAFSVLSVLCVCVCVLRPYRPNPLLTNPYLQFAARFFENLRFSLNICGFLVNSGERPPGLIQHVLTALVLGSWVLLLPLLLLGASDCSPGLAFCFMGPWTFAWLCCPQLPTTHAKTGRTAHVLQHRGAHAENSWFS